MAGLNGIKTQTPFPDNSDNDDLENDEDPGGLEVVTPHPKKKQKTEKKGTVEKEAA